jgi:N-acetyltransferase
MSYMRSSPPDEILHKRHHARVVRGIIWDGLGKGKGKYPTSKGEGKVTGWKVVSEGIRFGKRDEGVGKVVMCDGSYGGNKVRSEIHDHERD